MKKICFCTAGSSPALTHARNRLLDWGYDVASDCTEAVTHLLLPVPSLDATGAIRGGPALESLLPLLPEQITIFGGNLPVLPCRAVDFLKDTYYTAENALITAHCAMDILAKHIRTLTGAAVLVIGWGRIGKSLGVLLRNAGARVTIAARNPEHRNALAALGFQALPMPIGDATGFDAIINTVPAPVLSENAAAKHAVLLDLASVNGIAGKTVLWERGLPGRMAPEASGALIAKTALRYALEKE